MMRRVWETQNTTQAFEYHQPLPAACEYQISKSPQLTNEGGQVTLAATLSGTILAHEFGRSHPGPREPRVHQVNISNAFTDRMSRLQQCGIVLSADLQKVVGAFYAAKVWVTEWPLAKGRLSSTEDSLFAMQYGFIPPAQDADFLCRHSIISCGYLSIILNPLWHEIGLSVLKTSPHIFAMCHLYNALNKTYRVSGSRNPIDTLSQRHVKDLFMGELPKTIEAMHSRIQVTAGKSFAAVAVLKRVRNGDQRQALSKPLPNTKKTWDLTPSNLAIILRNHVHDRQDSLKTVHDLDAELARTGGISQLLSTDTDISGLLTTLANALEKELPLLRTDCLVVDAACCAMFRRMDERMGNKAVGEEDPDQSWEAATIRSYEIVFQVLTGMKNLKQTPAGTRVPTPRTDVMAQAVQDYINAGAIGVPY